MFGADYQGRNQKRIIFFKYLSVIMRSGIPIMRGLELLQQRSDKETASVCRSLVQSLAGGTSLSGAMEKEKLKKFFPELAVVLVGAGEECGKLQDILVQLAGYYTRQQELRSFVLKSACYPMFLICIACLVLCFFIFYMLPEVASVYQGMGAKPTGIFRLLLVWKPVLSDPFCILPVLGGFVCVLFFAMRKYALWLPHLPMFGECFRLVYEARFCKLLGLLLDAGIDITRAVDITAPTIGNAGYRRRLYVFNSRLRRGTEISAAISSLAGMLSPLTCELISIGTATGYLPQMLLEAERISDDALRDKLDRIRSFLGPCLLLVAAGVVGIVVCAIVGPLFELVAAVPEYN